jgi:hypothetical protein
MSLPKEIKTRKDAEQCVRILFREFAEGATAIVVQMVSPTHCSECGHEEFSWKDAYNFPMIDTSKTSYKEAKMKAVQARQNIIELLMQNTIKRERVVKG